MFPDAPSSRGVRHVLELSELVKKNRIAGGVVLFVIGHPSPGVFVPNIHTDPEFSGVLSSVGEHLSVRACSVSVTAGGLARVTDMDVPVNFQAVQLAREDRGVYLILLYMSTRKRIKTGSLGEIDYAEGWYVYVGSAKRGLSARVKRHLSKRKSCRWHIDYLSMATERIQAYPIYTDGDLECELACRISEAGGSGVRSFGSSDCSCPSHLFWFADNPFLSREFVDVLFFYRHRRGIENFLPKSIFRQER
jgi:sugar fermentation stimulation protein A